MTRSDPTVIPFPRRNPLHNPVPIHCPFQAAAELRAALLAKTLRQLPHVEDPAQLDEAAILADGLLSDLVVLYRNAIAQAQGRSGDEEL
ncbi:hypothetical protein [Zestomonas carbonaria]|uniref:Uncharacterized protein n=1 Tax=Zestomonas carbonaria TaxID=2762745 RepID=A0A7U7EJ64_9GAMM|nr:hypothetical protein [Pseudomonas carbonaria]CAD5105962.1 hypothetical protein PSEWESI4_00221 [Pseudomonas carbonaria]